MKKLLVITTVPTTLESFLLPFAYHFRQKGWQVDGMAEGVSTSASCLQAFDRLWEVKWSRNPLDPRNFLVAPPVLREVMKQGQYDLVHVHTPVAAFVSRYALKDFRKEGKCQVIYTAHGFHFHPRGKALKNAIFLTLEKLAGAWTDYLIVINREDEAAAKQHHILPPERVCYMPGIGVDLNYYNPNTVSDLQIAQVREELGITPANPLFLSAAEFIPRKHHRDIILAFAKLAKPEVHLALAGDGPLLPEMRQLAVDLGIKNQIHFLGERQDIPVLMRTCIATLLASEQEGLPRSVMESLSLEIPVIGTKIRGTEELLAGGCGLLVEVGDIEALTRSMNWILEHPEDAQKMGKLGRARMATYSLPNVIQLHENLYNSSLAKLALKKD
ncbi:glycosyltransferase family 4 protein [Aerosakkonema funiforme]|uniref:Glycosyltransferase family 4 protein n=1 Tax=Aerosakkonema funiforme FACHB-1375 TaxID=2949571 RepID=A0A926VM17_9CYAN|nr:glycosyltransferase family 4 protein [Aerosakkonema funiforme]MBD2184934.1 glycosyltransferase family 4 protein [Aerosakkonema funiforme FACHB-1375]